VTRRSATLLVFAPLFFSGVSCGDGATAAKDPEIVEFDAVVAACRDEHERVLALLSEPTLRTLAPLAAFSPRAAALSGWLADANAASAAPVETAAAARRRLLPDGRALVATAARTKPLLELLEGVRESAVGAAARRARFDAPLATLRRLGPAPIEARVESWAEALRTAEDALRRASKTLASDPTAAAAAAQDASIARGGLENAVKKGDELLALVGAAAATAADMDVRRDLAKRRFEWAREIVAQATTSDPTAARALQESLDAFEPKLAEANAAAAAAIAACASCSETAAADAAKATEALDLALIAATKDAAPLARRLGLKPPP
jgi:hypothetical protein